MKSPFILTALLGMTIAGGASAADITIYYSPSCPHCHHARDFIKNNLIYEYPSIKVTEVNVTRPEHQGVFSDALKKCEYESGGVPVLVVGEKCFQGYADYMQSDLRTAVEADLSEENKTFAKNVVSEMDEDATKYKTEHASEAAKITEYTSDTGEQKKNNTGSVIGFYALLVVLIAALGFVLVRKPKKK
ncbi:MAG: hypothetical protein KBS86_00490 [Proteobacteria bacterium]|nr:hypothetical protein [Candidatus Enterousia scatequi]